ncbi:MAG: flagellar hook-basal body complex protein, partial [Actinobacteria bacterium]|nr:flagellar hook-basal body complex protein [Actinomycetota bacterium]
MLSIYQSAFAGAQAQRTAFDIIANNIANVQTHGYRAVRTEFADLLYRQLAPEDIGLPPTDTRTLPFVGTGVQAVGGSIATRPGSFVSTGREFDPAIQGEGYFQVALADAQPGYTRAGNFVLASDRSLVTPDGHRAQPAITLAVTATQIRVREDGTVTSVDQAGAPATTRVTCAAWRRARAGRGGSASPPPARRCAGSTR